MKKLLLSFALICGALSAFAQAATTVSAAAAVPFSTTQGSAFNISLTVQGTTPFTYQWSKNGVNIPAPIGTASNLSFPSALASDAGTYVCTVSNSAGSAVSNAGNVSVSVPVIITAPFSVNVVIGPGSSAPPGAAK